jgi:hypothetical protein
MFHVFSKDAWRAFRGSTPGRQLTEYAQASWGAAVLRPYNIVTDGETCSGEGCTLS